jgi:YidC/Oxa1 family membrane protein insertase
MFVALSLFEPFAKLLAFFYSVWPSFGGAIALFTLTIMLILTPLTLKGTRSRMVLQALQPEMK